MAWMTENLARIQSHIQYSVCMLNLNLVLLVDNDRLANKMGMQLDTKDLRVQDAVQLV